METTSIHKGRFIIQEIKENSFEIKIKIINNKALLQTVENSISLLIIILLLLQ